VQPATVRPGTVRPRAGRPRQGGRRARAALLALAVAGLTAVAAGCAGSAPRPSAASSAPASGTTASGSTASAGTLAAGSSAAGAASGCDPQASSLRPSGPPAVTAKSDMAAIKARGYLIAGVDQSTYHFGYLNPLNGNIEGFDIDMIRAVAQAIFGSPDKVEYKAISDAERVPDVEDGTVDIVAHTMTITCDRLQQVDFSSVYFMAHQRVLVPDNSAAGGLQDLGGQRVCATKGSDSVSTIAAYRTHPKVVQVAYWTDCLVLLQQDQVAAISTDDSILAGLAAQDPFTKVVGPSLTSEPYGLAISKQHPDLVRFVNAVLAQERSDGSWAASYRRWIGSPVEKPPVAQYAS
jgi:polar amino acid transport system substrate-binding protein